jgi:hypothetical protein
LLKLCQWSDFEALRNFIVRGLWNTVDEFDGGFEEFDCSFEGMILPD